MHQLIFLLLVFTTGFSFSQDDSICPDVNGSIDHFLISRYKNSCIVGYNETKFDQVIVPISQVGADEMDKTITSEGKVIDILYGMENSSNTTVLEVQRNYEQALKSSGLEIVFSAFGKKQVAKYGSFSKKYPSIGSPDYLESLEYLKNKNCRLAFNHIGRNQENELAYFVAQGKKDDKKYTLVLYINLARGNYDIIKEKIYVHLKIVEAEDMETGQVSAASIDEKIKNEGKEVFHNILFEFGSDELTEESYVVIETLSEYLKANSDQKYYVVGHTDNVGSLSANQTLSEKRALAVVKALVEKFQTPANQLSAHGVGPLSPLALNTTEEGRAFNRRVEVVLK